LKWIRSRRPSPALVISLIALFVSLGGASYAAITITGKNVKNSSLTGKDVKNSSLTGKDVKNSSLTGSDVKNSSLTGSDVKNDNLTGSDVLESSLGKVPSAANADNAGTLDGKDSTDFGPKAFAQIAANGTLVAGKSKNFDGVTITKPAAGTYCMSGFNFTPLNAQVTLVNFDLGVVSAGTAGDLGNVCPANTQARVSTNSDFTFGNLADRKFFILLN
jgi:uncharacterized protein YjbI with pentapeptide repeats